MSRHHHHHQPPPAPAACCNCCSCGCCSSACAPVPPPASTSDHLLHAIAAHLLLNSPPPPTVQPQAPTPPPPTAHHTNLYSYQYLKPQHQHQPNPADHAHLLLHSLLHRVAALETSLPDYFPSSPPPPQPAVLPRAARPKPSCPTPPRAATREPSVRELAARTIQAYFRRFLARRSRTLRQLKHLAVLRSHAAALRASASGRRRGDPAAISEAVMSLLLQLDAIQGGDPMIREGKRAISRELTRILEFVDKVLVKEHEEMAVGALDMTGDLEGCNGGAMRHPRDVNGKKVSFYGNGEVHELGEGEEGNEVDESSESSSSAENDENKDKYNKRSASANAKSGLAAPMPVHMEPRRIAEGRR